jgi:hypothetical protein
MSPHPVDSSFHVYCEIHFSVLPMRLDEGASRFCFSRQLYCGRIGLGGRGRRVVVLIVLAFLLASCRNPSEPSSTQDSMDFRNAEWILDTLESPGSQQTQMRSIWGGSANDIYVVGHNDLAGNKMYHFDGHRWSVVRLASAEGGSIL